MPEPARFDPLNVASPPEGVQGVAALCFDQFTLLPTERRLLKSQNSVPLGTRAFDLLVALVERAPRVVSKEELLKAVWPGTAVEEINLRFQINGLRKALGDGPIGGRYIATVQGRGYCFVASVRPALPTGTGSAVRTNLPLPMHPIIDREDELAELEACLQQNRLVTVVGGGGFGKTRLVVELGQRVLARYPGGVWLVDLAPLSDAALIVNATATMLNLPADMTAEALARRIASRTMLLIFDNCEHLVDAVAALVKVLVSQGGALNVLATSQESLGVAEEQVYRLEPLSLAPAGGVEIARYGAIALFVELACRADRGFALSAENAESVAEICRRLDGVPLALEMAAARLPTLGLEGLVAGLSQPLSLLKQSPRRSEGRHSSLRDLAGWSYSLLDETDQAVFCRLAIFPGGFALDAAVALIAPLGIDRWGALDALWRLREKSLIAVELGAGPRYRMLETLRLYALEHLRANGDGDVVAEQHAKHFGEVFYAAEVAWGVMPDLDWVALYRPEIDNLRAALDWALATPDRRQIALSLAAPCLHFLHQLSLIAEGRRYSDLFAVLIDDDTPSAIEAGLMLQAAALWRNSPGAHIAEYIEQAITLYRRLNDGPNLAKALNAQGILHIKYLRYELAEAALTEALPMATGRNRVSLQINLGLITLQTDRYIESREHLSRALSMARERYTFQEISCLLNFSVLEYRVGNVNLAIERCGEAAACARATVGGGRLVSCLTNLATYLVMGDRPIEARPVAEEVYARLGDMERQPTGFLETCALLAAFEGRLTVAARLIGFVDAERARVALPREPSEQRLCDELTQRLETGLPAADIAALTAEGSHWTEAEAVRFTGARLFSANEPSR